MVLALASGIAPSVWAAEGDQAIATALELLKPKQDNEDEQDDDEDQPQMSG